MMKALLLVTIMGAVAAATPYFETTFSGFEAGSIVLVSLNPQTTSGLSSLSSTLAYSNTFSSTPNVGLGFAFVNANYPSTTATNDITLDIQATSVSTSSCQLKWSATANVLNQIKVYYIVAQSSLFMSPSTSLVDLSTTIVYTTNAATVRTATVSVPYKTKSNPANAVIVYTTIGINMIRTANTFSFTTRVVTRAASSFSLEVSVAGNNRIQWVRLNVFEYENIAVVINPPLYLDIGSLTTFAGSIPDGSNLNLATSGNLLMGMTDWTLSDVNAALTYDLSITGTAFSLTSSTVTQITLAYVWYRKLTCPLQNYLLNSQCSACHYSCQTCQGALATNCQTCPSTRTYVLASGTCPCTTGYIEVNSATTCVQLTCSPKCLTCSNLNQCGSCLAALNRVLSGTDCICKPYTIDVYDTLGQTFCYPCHLTCYSCSASFLSNACMSCSSVVDRRQLKASTSTCECMDGYYDRSSSNTAVCGPCHYSCQTCTTNSACTLCDASKQRTYNSVTKVCSCNSGYYDDGLSQQCAACPRTCLSCSSGSVCTACATATRSLIGNNCECLASFYDDGSSRDCQPCNFRCATCTEPNNCASCNSNFQRQLFGTTCICTEGTFEVVNQQLCSVCHSSCKSCSGSNNNNCVTCNSNNYRSLSLSSTCACSDGYYDQGALSVVCGVCYYTCATCSDGQNCLTCSAANFRNMVSNGCNCQDGYFDNGYAKCASCMKRCLTCTSSTSCSTCDTTTRDISDLTNCQCKPGFYETGSSSSCSPCRAGCLTCSNGNQCDTCPTLTVLSTVKLCVCATRTLSPQCLACNYECLSCSTTVNTCTSCSVSAMRYIDTASSRCLCASGFYSDGTNQLCLRCHYSCETCSKASACLTCPTNRQKLVTPGLCTCLPQYFQNSASQNCLPCHYSCQSCSTTATTCISCNGAKFRETSISTTLCTCMAGYYDTLLTELCLQCSITCATCSTNTMCATCNANHKRYLNNNQCVCMQGYYDDSLNSLCLTCHYTCATCVDATTCLTCPTGRITNPVTLICDCVSGSFQNAATKLCQICQLPCITCNTNPTTCLSCSSDRSLSNSAQCVCNIGLYESNGNCPSCLTTCETCTNGNSCVTCKAGLNRQLDASNSCICLPFYHDQSGTLLACQKCHYSCSSCTQASTCLTCPSGRTLIPNGYCGCPVNNYYDDGSNPTCAPCSYSCLSCQGSSSSCTACSAADYRSLSNSACLCLATYYDNGVNVRCQACHYTCQTCISATSCALCNAQLYRIVTVSPFCECMSGYYDTTGVSLCTQCSYQCLTCSSNTVCLTCPSGRTLSNNHCICPATKFDNGQATCQSCHYSCATCSSLSACSLCPSTRLLNLNGQCVCSIGYYDILNQNLCSACPIKCRSCTSPLVCTQCDSALFRLLQTDRCVCLSGYYESADLTVVACQPCQYSCLSCVSLTQCTSCSSLLGRQYSLSTRKCQCMAGQYDDGLQAQCIGCPYDCLTCSSATVCLTCPTDRSLNTISNRCDCLSAFYLNGAVCSSCPPECATCTDLQTCTQCQSPRLLTGASCLCPIRFYPVVNSATCLSCHYSCAACTGPLSCSSCDSTKHRIATNSLCQCANGYYDNLSDETCQPCHYSCLTCTDSTACSACDSSALRVRDTSTGYCACTLAYTEDPSTKVCLACHYSCASCLTNPSTCQSCTSSSGRILQGSACLCPKIGYFDDTSNPLCLTCPTTCKSCSSATVCTDCDAATYRTLQSSTTCACSIGYYDPGQVQCAPCSYKCQTCSISSQNCLACSIQFLRSSPPLCSCTVGTYDDGINSQCQPCHFRCQSCANSITCLTCSTNNNRAINPATLMCDCLPSFYELTNVAQCVACPYQCLTCLSGSACLTCPTSRLYSTGQCNCRVGYYEANLKECQPCNSKCLSCSSANSCDSCPINSQRYLDSFRQCTCKDGYYEVPNQQQCAQCAPSCLTCNSNSACLTCYPFTNTVIATPGSSFCTCPTKYFSNAIAASQQGRILVCSVCHYSCGQCAQDFSSCSTCPANSMRVLTLGRCPCQLSYFDDGINPTCLPCSTNCQTCWLTTSTSCLTCISTAYFLNNQCFSLCPDTYFGTISQGVKVCVSCPSNCIQCSSTTLCTLCQSTYKLWYVDTTHVQCTQGCPQYYYDLNGVCRRCESPCFECSGTYICSTCLPSLYLSPVDSYCYPCPSSCQQCTGPSVQQCTACVPGYFFNGKSCIRINCPANQFVNTLIGCANCTMAFANSASCLNDGTKPTSCKDGYVLVDTTISGKLTSQCVSCSKAQGWTLSSTNSCIEQCGDGVMIQQQCDDGNVWSGDGCSSSCQIESGWICLNRNNNEPSVCSLNELPTFRVSQVTKINNANQISVILILTPGLRLSDDNFMIVFNPKRIFTYQTKSFNNRYDAYQLIINYSQSVQGCKLKIKLSSNKFSSNNNSPQSQTYYNDFTEMTRLSSLPTLLSTGTQIQLSIQIPIETVPLAVYTSPTFNSTAFYLMVCALLLKVLVYLTLLVPLLIEPLQTMVSSLWMIVLPLLTCLSVATTGYWLPYGDSLAQIGWLLGPILDGSTFSGQPIDALAIKWYMKGLLQVVVLIVGFIIVTLIRKYSTNHPSRLSLPQKQLPCSPPESHYSPHANNQFTNIASNNPSTENSIFGDTTYNSPQKFRHSPQKNLIPKYQFQDQSQNQTHNQSLVEDDNKGAVDDNQSIRTKGQQLNPIQAVKLNDRHSQHSLIYQFALTIALLPDILYCCCFIWFPWTSWSSQNMSLATNSSLMYSYAWTVALLFIVMCMVKWAANIIYYYYCYYKTQNQRDLRQSKQNRPINIPDNSFSPSNHNQQLQSEQPSWTDSVSSSNHQRSNRFKHHSPPQGRPRSSLSSISADISAQLSSHDDRSRIQHKPSNSIPAAQLLSTPLIIKIPVQFGIFLVAFLFITVSFISPSSMAATIIKNLLGMTLSLILVAIGVKTFRNDGWFIGGINWYFESKRLKNINSYSLDLNEKSMTFSHTRLPAITLIVTSTIIFVLVLLGLLTNTASTSLITKQIQSQQLQQSQLFFILTTLVPAILLLGCTGLLIAVSIGTMAISPQLALWFARRRQEERQRKLQEELEVKRLKIYQQTTQEISNNIKQVSSAKRTDKIDTAQATAHNQTHQGRQFTRMALINQNTTDNGQLSNIQYLQLGLPIAKVGDEPEAVEQPTTTRGRKYQKGLNEGDSSHRQGQQNVQLNNGTQPILLILNNGQDASSSSLSMIQLDKSIINSQPSSNNVPIISKSPSQPNEPPSPITHMNSKSFQLDLAHIRPNSNQDQMTISNHSTNQGGQSRQDADTRLIVMRKRKDHHYQDSIGDIEELKLQQPPSSNITGDLEQGKFELGQTILATNKDQQYAQPDPTRNQPIHTSQTMHAPPVSNVYAKMYKKLQAEQKKINKTLRFPK